MSATHYSVTDNERTSTQDTATCPQWLDEQLYPFQNRFVDEGRGPTLLLLHGNPMWSFLYRHIIIRLSRRFGCVAVDYPGFGAGHLAALFSHTAMRLFEPPFSLT